MAAGIQVIHLTRQLLHGNRMMRVGFALFALMTSFAFAELPMSVEEYIFGQSGMTDYVGWCTRDGVKKFNRKVFLFSQATVRTAETKEGFVGDRNSYQIQMSTNLEAKVFGKEQIRHEFFRMRSTLVNEFDQEKICDIREEDSKIHFCGRDIDGLKWDVYAIATCSNSQWHVSCEFVNEYHRQGKFISCECE